MRGYCATCGRVVEGQMLCPVCGVTLAQEPGLTVPPPPVGLDDPPDCPHFLRRMALGGITLLGLYNGLKHLLLAGVLAYTPGNALPGAGQVCLLAVATLLAAIAAGTVNRRAEVAGFLLAAGAAAGYLGPELALGGDLPEQWLIGIPTLLVMVGVGGGIVGRLMIPPAPMLPHFTPVHTPVKVSLRRPVKTVWWRIVAGTVLVVLGTNYAEFVRYWLLVALSGRGGTAPLVVWQISVVAALAGGVLSGAHTRCGFRQGFITGLLAAAGTVVALASGSQPMVLEFWLDQLSVKEPGPLPYAVLGGTICIATTIGGWFGEQFLPPSGRR